MLTLREIKAKEMIPPRMMLKMNIGGVYMLFKVMLTNLPMMRTMKNMETENHYIRPIPPYTLPTGLPTSISHSNQRYLRPTHYCNCEAPLVQALAKALGAGSKPPLEFANAAFEFTKRNIILEICPIDDVELTLQRGTGTCIHKMSVFIALCRAAGIPARYKFYALTMLDQWVSEEFTRAPLMKKWYDAMGLFLLHGEGEILIDGKWIPADVGAEPPRQANSGMPITVLGEESIGLWFFPIPGTTFIRESVPIGLATPSRFLMDYLLPSSIEGINTGIQDQIRNGAKILKDAGGEKAYDEQARKKRRQQTPLAGLQASDSIVFEDD